MLVRLADNLLQFANEVAAFCMILTLRRDWPPDDFAAFCTILTLRRVWPPDNFAAFCMILTLRRDWPPKLLYRYFSNLTTADGYENINYGTLQRMPALTVIKMSTASIKSVIYIAFVCSRDKNSHSPTLH